MASAERKQANFVTGDLQQDDSGTFVTFTHGLNRQFPVVELWRTPSNMRDPRGMVRAITKNTIRVYPDGGIPVGTGLTVRVVG